MTDQQRKQPRPGSMSDRDVRVPKDRPTTPAHGTPIWLDEPTNVGTDAQVFRAVKALGEELNKSKLEAARAHGALKQEVSSFKTTVNERLTTMSGRFDERLTKQDLELKSQSLALAKMSGQLDVLVPIARMRPSSSETKLVETAKTQRARISTNGKIIIAIVGAAIATIGTVLVAVLS